MQTLLVTGGSGFIGSNFIPYFLEKKQNIQIVNLDALTYAGDESNLIEVQHNSRYTFIKEAAYKSGFITKKQLRTLAQPLLKSGYSKHLLEI